LLIHLPHSSILDVSSPDLYSCQSGQAYIIDRRRATMQRQRPVGMKARQRRKTGRVVLIRDGELVRPARPPRQKTGPGS